MENRIRITVLADNIAAPPFVEEHGLDQLVLSHGHYDHTGNLKSILEKNPSVTVRSHPDVILPRWRKRSDGSFKPLGIRADQLSALDQVSPEKWVRKKAADTDSWLRLT